MSMLMLVVCVGEQGFSDMNYLSNESVIFQMPPVLQHTSGYSARE